MSNIIHLLPDNVANQIAAGEVIQRPASVVKELLENAIDAKSTRINLSIKDAGKTLIQVTDNGVGMTEADARMSFERHATSKIKDADELFKLKTKGFRGEALASMASVAHVALKTRQADSDLGTEITIEGSIVQTQEPVTCPVGSTFSVKNLFFNVPARRNFLKSDQVETKHVIEELVRVALAHPDIEFSMHHNGDEVYFLPSGPLRQRIVGIFGKHFNERLVPIEEETTIVNIQGFLIKPEHARKSRGEQYFFVNDRFIKSHYLNHAVSRAYDELILKDQFPGYFIFMQVDPSSIDVNIHPTKTEIKFEEERSIYAIIQSAVRSSLGKFNIAPTIDFDQEQSFNQFIDPNSDIKAPQISVDTNYNPFKQTEQKQQSSSHKSSIKPDHKLWETVYDVAKSETGIQSSSDQPLFEQKTEGKFLQLNDKYLLGSIKSGYMIIDQYRAHYRILFEKMQLQLDHQNGKGQGLIFPEKVELAENEFKHINAIENELHALGFAFTKSETSIEITAKPTDLMDCNSQELIEELLDRFKLDIQGDQWSPKESLARSLASSGAVKRGRKLNAIEMNNLIDELFACSDPQNAPNGKTIVKKIGFDEIEKMLN